MHSLQQNYCIMCKCWVSSKKIKITNNIFNLKWSGGKGSE